MNKYVYNGCMLCGLGLVGVGVGLVDLPSALVTVGGLLILLTIYGAQLHRNVGKMNVSE